ncbi:MAG TPA: TetR/AcrR family transcriptional regulator [Kofleriaceae bacterium]
MAKNRVLPTLSPRKLPTQERARRTYSAILEAGARILERQGYEALTTNHVADLAGVGIASLYEYFPNKHALVAEIVRHVLEELLADLARSAQLITTSPHQVALEAWLGSMYAAVAKRRGVVKVIVQEVPFLWDIPAVDNARTMLLALARSTHELGASVGRAPLSDAMIYLLATMTGAAVLEAVLRPPAAHSAEELIETLAEIVNRVTGTREESRGRRVRRR